LATISPQSNDDAQWPPPNAKADSDWVMPPWGTTIGRGIIDKCPHCGQAPIFNGYLAVHELCAACAAPLGQMPADDTPPYISMVVVAHFVGLFIVLMFKFHWHPGPIEIAILLVLLVLLCMVTLRMAKGAVIGILLKLDNNRVQPDA
jgi:uncharacterized protein (DUF983 family)